MTRVSHPFSSPHASHQKNSPRRLIPLYPNRLQRVLFSPIHTRTRLTDLLPIARRLQILRPKWPRSTLLRPRFINPTNRLLRFRLPIKKNAVIPILSESLSQRTPTKEQPGIPGQKLLDFHVEMLGDSQRLRIINPDRSRRTGAAVPAQCTFKAQTVSIPFGRVCLFCVLFAQWFST